MPSFRSPKAQAEHAVSRKIALGTGRHDHQRAWSQSFSSASKRELGFSNGGHGLRHSYAQERMAELQQRGVCVMTKPRLR